MNRVALSIHLPARPACTCLYACLLVREEQQRHLSWYSTAHGQFVSFFLDCIPTIHLVLCCCPPCLPAVPVGRRRKATDMCSAQSIQVSKIRRGKQHVHVLCMCGMARQGMARQGKATQRNATQRLAWHGMAWAGWQDGSNNLEAINRNRWTVSLMSVPVISPVIRRASKRWR